MAVDLADLIPSLLREVQPPGADLFPTASDDDWLGQLQDSFWEAKLYGFFDSYTEAEGLVLPLSGTDDLEREWQQLIVLFAGIRVIRQELKNTNTAFRAKAGPVEFETASSAYLLRDILDTLQEKVDYVLKTLGDLGAVSDFYINAVCARTASISYGDDFSWR